MDALQRLMTQFQTLLGGMAPSQRLTFLAVPLLVLGGLGVLVYTGQAPAREYLLGGKVFSAEELRHAQEALRGIGLNEFEVEGQRIRVPKADVLRYNAALVEKGATPAQFGDELLKMYEKAGIFAGTSDRQQLMELGKQQELAKIIRAIGDVEDARVSWERAKRRPFGGDPKVTALVSVRPRPGREITPSLVKSLRLAVAGAVADLSADDVVVLDTRTGQAHKASEKDDVFGSEFVDQVHKFTELHRRTISEALSFIPEVLVTVHVDLENLKTSYMQEREIGTKAFPIRSVEQNETLKSTERRGGREPGMQANLPRNLQQASTNETVSSTEKTTLTNDNLPAVTKIREQTYQGLLPKSVQVSVSIPREYYRKVALKQGESETDKAAFATKLQQIEAETEREVGQIVAKLVPAGSPADAISVTSYVDLQSAPETTGVPMTETLGNLVSRWGGPIGLALFALWALWMLNRSLKKLPQDVPDEPPAGTPPAGANLDEAEDEEPAEPTKRDQLQTLVRDNPEMAAAVISRWLQPAK